MSKTENEAGGTLLIDQVTLVLGHGRVLGDRGQRRLPRLKSSHSQVTVLRIVPVTACSLLNLDRTFQRPW